MDGTSTRQTAASVWRLRWISERIDRGIASVFRSWGYIVTNYAYLVITVATVFAAVWGYIFLKNFAMDRDMENFFTPNDAQSFRDRDYVDDVYGSYGGRARVIAIKKPSSGDADGCRDRLLLSDGETSRKNIQEYFRFYQEMARMEAKYKKKWYALEDICVRPSESSPCLVTSVLDLWNYEAAVIEADDFQPLRDIDRANLTDRFGLPLSIERYLGKSKTQTCQLEDYASSNVEAFGMTIMYQNDREEVDGAKIDPESSEWAWNLKDMIREFSHTSDLDFYLAAYSALSRETNEVIFNEIRYLVCGIFLISIFACITLYKNSCLFCKSHLAIVSLTGICFAMLSGLGIVQACGLPFNMIVLTVPFLVVGLGIDDTFIIIGAYQRVDYRLPVPEKIALTLERAGSSIFITSVTDCFAFLMAVFTSLSGIRVFGVYAAVTVFFDFLFQVSFFAGFLVLDARREERSRDGISTLALNGQQRPNECTSGRTSTAPPVTQEMSTSVNSNGAIPANSSNGETIHLEKSAHQKKMCGSGVYDPQRPSISTRIAGRLIPSVTLHPAGRIAVIAIECVLLAFAIYGCTKVEMNLHYLSMIARDGSLIKKAYDLEEQYFVGEQSFFSVYTKETDDDYFYHQHELAALKDALENDEFVAPPVHSWYEGYTSWLSESEHASDLVNGSAPDAESFNKWLVEYLRGEGAIYQRHVRFTASDDPRVFSSKFDALTVRLVSAGQEADLLDSIRNSIEAAAPSLRPVAYAHLFLFVDGYRTITRETLRNVILAGTAVLVVCCVMLARIRMALIVVSMVALTDVMIYGFVWYAGLTLNPITSINIVLVVGLAVDYSAHIAHSFLAISGDRVTRAKGALDHIGGEVMAGAFSTWLGIVCLVFTHFYSYRVFFKMMFAMVVAGVWHGLILLPVLLSFMGSTV